jgi:hypothetical protein
MIVGVSVKNYRVIRSLRSLPLGRFHVLVGPNASGKSTFLDAIDFVRDCLVKGPRAAVEDRVPELRDLTFMRRGGNIEIELWLDLAASLADHKDSLLQYRLALREDDALGVCVEDESLRQYSKAWLPAGKTFEFSSKVKPRRLLGKTSKGSDFSRPRRRSSRLGPRQSPARGTLMWPRPQRRSSTACSAADSDGPRSPGSSRRSPIPRA